mmetsp:Transcript_55361/g.49852  ORF Transcript_55361/g.49852 Transcript_55361/m.49852 type:complete len:115 (-) Transcript_55361:122-466(-)
MTAKAIQNKDNGKYLDLFISCPACGKGAASKWYHVGCGKNTEINEFGYVRCKNAHGAPFFNWKWNCGKHNGRYLKADPEFLSSAFQHLIESMAVKDFKWYAKLVTHVNEQFEGQ